MVRTPPEPLNVDAVNVVAVGIAAWGVLLILCLAFLGPLTADGHRWWMWTCVAGLALGIYGEWYCLRRRNRLRRQNRPTSL